MAATIREGANVTKMTSEKCHLIERRLLEGTVKEGAFEINSSALFDLMILAEEYLSKQSNSTIATILPLISIEILRC